MYEENVNRTKSMARINVKSGKRKAKNRSNKIHLVFDEAKRRDFLSGFHKRKLQRKKQAQEELAKELKEERKRLKSEAKESYKKFVVSHRDIPELENYFSKEYEEDDVTIKVVELSANDIAKQNNFIGVNQPKYSIDEDQDENGSDNECDEEKEEVPGMELKATKQPKAKAKLPAKEFQSEKQLKKELKKQATKNVKNSKVFQKKNKMEQQKQKKRALKGKKQQEGSKSKFRRKKGSKKHK